MSFSDKIIKEAFQLLFCHIFWVALSMKKDVLPTPKDISFGGARAVVSLQAGELYLFKKFRFLVVCCVILTP